jgi:hypothetical protein
MVDAMQEMDMAADAAEQELRMKMENDKALADAIRVLAAWWKKHFMKAGHKRLGRIIAKLT